MYTGELQLWCTTQNTICKFISYLPGTIISQVLYNNSLVHTMGSKNSLHFVAFSCPLLVVGLVALVIVFFPSVLVLGTGSFVVLLKTGLFVVVLVVLRSFSFTSIIGSTCLDAVGPTCHDAATGINMKILLLFMTLCTWNKISMFFWKNNSKTKRVWFKNLFLTFTNSLDPTTHL